MTPTEYIAGKNWETRRKGGEIQTKFCPFCKGGEHRDAYTFGVNIASGAWNCKRGSCAKSGSFWELQKELGDPPTTPQPATWQPTPQTQANYRKPDTAGLLPPTQQAVSYLAQRGFSRATLTACDIRVDERGNVVFPYREDPGGPAVMLKKRAAKDWQKGGKVQKAWRDEGGKPVLWRLEKADPSAGPLLITFGEYDAMACVEAGLPNACSLPSGDNDLTWIRLDWQRLEAFSEIILWPDNDVSGIAALQEIAQRLGRARCRVVAVPDKDANDTLRRAGREVVAQAVDQAAWYPIVNLWRVCDIPDEPPNRDGIRFELPQLDAMTGGVRPGEVTVWAGDNGAGKTTGILNFVVAASVNQGQPVFLWSGEMARSRVKYWSELIFAGAHNLADHRSASTGRTYYQVNSEPLRAIRQWYADYYYLYDARVVKPDDLFDAAAVAYQRYGCKRFVLDNLMLLTMGSNERDEYRQQAQFVERCKRFAEDNGVCVDLVAHNRKPGDPHTPPTKYSVKGASEITNLVDNAGAFWRVPNISAIYNEFNCDALLCWFKSRDSGATDNIRLKFDQASKRFAQADDSADLGRMYGWQQV